jgi:23S rRNA (uracil1939-C5)-methyltransferase
MNRTITVEIEKMVYGGKGMGRVGGKVVFVPFTAPGEQIEAEVVREKKDYAEAVLKKVKSPSPKRVKPFCPLYGDCGGCQYQHFSHEDQLKLKEEALRETLQRLTRKGNLEISPIIASPADRAYRIRAQFKMGIKEGKKILGFRAWRTHRVVETEECPLLHPLANRILHGLRQWLEQTKEVSVKEIDLKVSPEEGGAVVNLRGEDPWDDRRVEELRGRVIGLKGVVSGGKRQSSWGDLNLAHEGPEIRGRKIRFQTRGESFVQVNPGQNHNLIRGVVEWAGLGGEEKVVDLFCGSGNLTLPLALGAKKAWGIDLDGQAIESARENARVNGIRQCAFWAGTAEEGIRRVREETPSVDLAVLDPPRAGARGVLEPLVSLQPRKILYVSCEPPTLARDLARLVSLGYNVKRLQPLDMFPQTYHIEVIAELITAGVQAGSRIQKLSADS